MKVAKLFTIAALALIGLSSGTHASLVAYTDAGASLGGAGGPLNIGRIFDVSGTGITVRDLGVLDIGQDGLVNSHDVTLFKIGGPIATVNIPAGTGATLNSGFRFEPITPIFLVPGTYAVLAYGTNTNGGDGYGDGGGTPTGANNVSESTILGAPRFDPYQFTTDASPIFPAEPGNGDSNNHSSASFLFDVGNTTIPEPTSLAVLSLGGLALLRRRK